MPRTAAGAPWEQGLRAAVRAGKPGWTVNNHNGKVRLKWRPPGSGSQQAVVLPVDWAPASTDKALLLINRIAKSVLSNEHGTLKSALAAAQGASTTMRQELAWLDVADSLRDVLMNHRNEIRATTWRDNYQPYVTEALRLIDAGQASDGHSLLKGTLAKWAGMAPSRAACCIALRKPD